jgi:hypothetical protein
MRQIISQDKPLFDLYVEQTMALTKSSQGISEDDDKMCEIVGI